MHIKPEGIHIYIYLFYFILLKKRERDRHFATRQPASPIRPPPSSCHLFKNPFLFFFPFFFRSRIFLSTPARTGLRWWNKVADDGTSEWIFESKRGFAPHPSESKIFWWSLYLTPIIWSFFLITAILKLSFAWSVLVLVGISLSTSNLFGYRKCDANAKERAEKDPVGGIASGIGQTLMAGAASRLAAGAFSGANFFGGGDTAAGAENGSAA